MAAVVAKLVLGEGDAAIVYATDAAAAPALESVAVPPHANVPATYAAVVLAASPRQEAARAFLGWFTGPEGRAILAGFGFLAPEA